MIQGERIEHRVTDDRSLIEEALRNLPGGQICTMGHAQTPPGSVFSHGCGAYIFTTVGDRLLDVSLAHGALLLGHCPPAVVAAVCDQLNHGTAFSGINRPVIELARLVVEAAPCADKARFTNSGTEAVLLALRLVRAFSGREKVLKFEGAYHGFADPLLFHTNYGIPGSWPEHPLSTADTPGVPACLGDLVLNAPYNNIDSTREIIAEHHADLAAVFLEPVMRGLAPVPGFLEGVRDLTSQYRIPLVFDEVITGFRLAYGGAQEYYGVIPDLAVYGKALGAGYPIGAVAGNEAIMSCLDPTAPDGTRVYSLGSSHGNPLCATAAVANLLELRKPYTYERLNAYGDRLREGLAELFLRYGLEAQMTGAGSIVENFFGSGPITDYRSAMRSNLQVKARLGQGLPRHGVLGGGGRHNSSVCHGEEELAVMLGAVDASLREL